MGFSVFATQEDAQMAKVRCLSLQLRSMLEGVLPNLFQSVNSLNIILFQRDKDTFNPFVLIKQLLNLANDFPLPLTSFLPEGIGLIPA